MHASPNEQSACFAHSTHSPRRESQMIRPPSLYRHSRLLRQCATEPPPDALASRPASRRAPPDPPRAGVEPPVPPLPPLEPAAPPFPADPSGCVVAMPLWLVSPQPVPVAQADAMHTTQ